MQATNQHADDVFFLHMLIYALVGQVCKVPKNGATKQMHPYSLRNTKLELTNSYSRFTLLATLLSRSTVNVVN